MELDEEGELLTLDAELEFEVTVVFLAACAVFWVAGGPFAAVNDVVNCLAMPVPTVGAVTAEAACVDEILVPATMMAVAVCASAFAWLALLEL